MAADRYALIDAQGVKRNITLWDADADPDWSPPPGFTVVPDDGSPFIATPAPPTADERLDALHAALAAITEPAATTDVLDALRTALETPT